MFVLFSFFTSLVIESDDEDQFANFEDRTKPDRSNNQTLDNSLHRYVYWNDNSKGNRERQSKGRQNRRSQYEKAATSSRLHAIKGPYLLFLNKAHKLSQFLYNSGLIEFYEKLKNNLRRVVR